ncbi:MFS transporter [Frankia sp. R82]|uniref:MFS transporter n=1 Tax=Frankia sp. R82 TaxID=2950553 RepID=UPI0020441177|nr:MFS transporter [Frankia sp. R82]MCM3885355.1 MFS transporter [Frankia sp. R82]
MSEPTIASAWDRRVRALTIGLVAIITLVAFEALAVVTVLPEVVTDLHGFGLYGWVTSAFFLGTTIGIVLAGSGVDRTGPARPFLVGLVCFAVGLAVAAVAPTMPVLVAARALQGVGGGTIPAVAYAAIGRAYPNALHPRVFAVLSTAWVVPGLGGPALSSLIAAHLGWRWVFGGLLPLTIAFGLIPLRALRALPAAADPAGDTDPDAGPARGGALMLAAVRVTVGAGLVLAGLTSRSLLGLPLLGAGLVCGFGPLRRLLPAGTLRMRPGIPAAVASRGLLTWAFFGTDSFVPLSFTAVRHESTMVAGIAVSSATLCWAAGSWTQARLAGQVRTRSIVAGGLVLVAVGTGGFATVLLPAWLPLAVPVACWGLAGYGIGLAYSTIVTLVLALTPQDRQGEASMAVSLTDNLGTAFGAGLGGVAVAAGQATAATPASGLAATFALTTVIGLAGALLVARRLPEDRRAGG